jgi:hypothetical protein
MFDARPELRTAASRAVALAEAEMLALGLRSVLAKQAL